MAKNLISGFSCICGGDYRHYGPLSLATKRNRYAQRGAVTIHLLSYYDDAIHYRHCRHFTLLRSAIGTIMRDPGLQPERTQQAWSRTLLLLAINGLLFLRLGLIHSSWLALLGAVIAIALLCLISFKRSISTAYQNSGLKIDSSLFLYITAFAIFTMSILLIVHLLVDK